MSPEKLLHIAISELEFSSDFRKSCEDMNFATLEDITKVLPSELINKKGFSYSWLGELSAYLDKKGLLHLLQNLSGRNYG